MKADKEALDFVSDDPVAVQLKGSCITLGYDQTDLTTIVEKNIIADKIEYMAEPQSSDLLIRWVGERSHRLVHVTTGEIERIDNYIIRHSFGRPRDLMVLGGAIANIAPDRRIPSDVKWAVNSAAANLVQVDIDLAISVIDRNVIQRSEVAAINQAYRQRFQSTHGKALEMHRGVLDYLFQIGLIGYVGTPVAGGGPQSQIFQLPGSVVSRAVQFLPFADAYLVHPALSDPVALRKGEQYTKNLNRFNIIGHGMGWRRPSDGCYVLNADGRRFTAIMDGGVEYAVFVRRYGRVRQERRRQVPLCRGHQKR